MSMRCSAFMLTFFIATARISWSAENDIRLLVDYDTKNDANKGLKATIGATLHVIQLRVYTDLECDSLKRAYRFSVRISSNERLKTEVLTLQDRSRFMLICDKFFDNNDQYYMGAVKFAEVSSKDFGRYTICACPMKSDTDSDTYCSSNECEILHLHFVDETESTCAPADHGYAGKLCSSSLLGYSSVKHHLSGTLEKIAALSELVPQNIDDSTFMEKMDPGCRILIQIAPCFIAFPKCKKLENETVELKHMCKQDCSAIFDVCKTWLENSQRNQNSIFKEFAKNMSQVLEQLNLGKEFDKSLCQRYNDSECISINATVLKKKLAQNVTSQCYDPDYMGTSYRGQISKSISGKSCVKWDRSEKYEDLRWHSLNTIKYVELYGSENFCRNPINVTTQSIDQSKPWCFVDYRGNWEPCDVPMCYSAVLTPSNTGVFNFILAHFSSPWIVTLLGVVVAAILAIVAMTFFLFRQKCVIKSFPNQNMFRDLNSSPQQRPYFNQDETGLRHYDRNQIETLSKIGQGEFGVVYKAQIKSDMNAPMMVAVKALREDASNTEQKQFRSEAKLMNEFNHGNIVKFCGVCFEGEPLYMIFEYMPNGDLHDFLRKTAPSVLNSDEGRGATNIVIDKVRQNLFQFLSISVQIARGLAYLAEQQYVHRDIAARNVLLGDYGKDNILPVKLSDFGLSRSVYARDYYRIKSKSLLPVRWMPPEAITYTTFTAASDVYSFGVVLWEIFSFGTQPYENVSNEEVVAHILKPELLKQPIGCPDSMYEIMKQCWNYHSQQRPSAQELIEKLQREANNCSFMSPRTIRHPSFPQSNNCYNNAQAIAKQQKRMNSRGGLLKTVPHRVESNGNTEMAYPPNHMSLRAPHATSGGRSTHLSSSIPHLQQQGPPMFNMSSRLPGTFPPQFQNTNPVEQFNINENVGYFGGTGAVGSHAATQKPIAPKRSMNNESNFDSSTMRPMIHPPARFAPQQPRAPAGMSRFQLPQPQSMPVSAGHVPPISMFGGGPGGRSMKRPNMLVNNNAAPSMGVAMDMNKFSAC